MAETLRTTSKLESDVMVVRVHCENITHFDVEPLQKELATAGPQARWKLAIDMTEVLLVGSAGLGLFINVNKQAKTGGGKMVLFGLSEEIYQSMKITKLTTLFTIVKDKAAAMKALA